MTHIETLAAQGAHNPFGGSVAPGSAAVCRGLDAGAGAFQSQGGTMTEELFFDLEGSDDGTDWLTALEQCDLIISLCDDLPERADDFRDSIESKVGDIALWLEENERVTEAQLEALDNMEAGVRRWLD